MTGWLGIRHSLYVGGGGGGELFVCHWVFLCNILDTHYIGLWLLVQEHTELAPHWDEPG